MGSVALTAGSWLASELKATHQLDLPAEEFFDVEKVEVHHGVARVGWRPSSTFHRWKNPEKGPDLLIFIGEAQPSVRGLEFCHRILDIARSFGVKRVVTFAAMATQMHPGAAPRVFAVANEERLLLELQPHSIELLEEGQINGLNGVLLAAAAELGIDGICLLGEMPFFAVGVQNPGAAVAVLEVFSSLSGVPVELGELRSQGETVKRRLSQILSRMPQVEIDDEEGEEGEGEAAETADPELRGSDLKRIREGAGPRRKPSEPDELAPGDLRRIEMLFLEAQRDRTRALALKSELDRLGVFARFEDRFLDLFRQGN
jgi:predicted ATP-grasp superfamily ATP-dependent carboligase